jgi:hypothetical protein
MVEYAPLLNSEVQPGIIKPLLQPAGYCRGCFTGDETVEFAFFKLVVWHIVVSATIQN